MNRNGRYSMKKRWIGFGIGIVCLAVGAVTFAGDFFEPDMEKLPQKATSERTKDLGLAYIWDSPQEYHGKESLAEHDQYYYGVLSAEEQQIYGEIYTAMCEKTEYAKVSTTDDEMIARIMEYVLLDNPELFYVNTLQTQLTTVGGLSTMRVQASQNMTEAQQEQALAQIQSWAKNGLMQCSENMSDYDKALLFYEYVVSNTEYVADAPYNQSLYSATLGQSVCRGYACAFKYLCDQVGIPCIIVSGTMDGQSHAWNMAFLDGQWCHIDCTAGDDMSQAGIEIDYSWFGLNDAMLEVSHVPSEPDMIPEADSMNNDYYYRNALYFERCEFNDISWELSAGMDFSFQCSSYEVYEEYRNLLSTSYEVGEVIGESQVQFIGNNNTYTIFIFFE